MTDQIEQDDHFFNEGDRVVLTKDGFKKMSYRDVLLKSLIYRVIAVIDRNRFKVKAITR